MSNNYPLTKKDRKLIKMAVDNIIPVMGWELQTEENKKAMFLCTNMMSRALETIEVLEKEVSALKGPSS